MNGSEAFVAVLSVTPPALGPNEEVTGYYYRLTCDDPSGDGT